MCSSDLQSLGESPASLGSVISAGFSQSYCFLSAPDGFCSPPSNKFFWAFGHFLCFWWVFFFHELIFVFGRFNWINTASFQHVLQWSVHIPNTPSRWTRLNHSTASSSDSWNRTGSELISSLVLEHLFLCWCNTHLKRYLYCLRKEIWNFFTTENQLFISILDFTKIFKWQEY